MLLLAACAGPSPDLPHHDAGQSSGTAAQTCCQLLDNDECQCASLGTSTPQAGFTQVITANGSSCTYTILGAYDGGDPSVGVVGQPYPGDVVPQSDCPITQGH